MNDSESFTGESSCDVSRRAFLARMAGAAVASTVLSGVAFAGNEPSKKKGKPPLTKSRVVQVEDARIIPDKIVQRGLLQSYLQDALMIYGSATSFDRALHATFKQDDIILFKFNKSDAAKIGTSDGMTAVLVELFVRAGYSPEQMMILEGGDLGEYDGKTKQPDLRWQGKTVKFGKSGEDCFVAALDQATAIVNVPFLKTHHLATMTSCLKNLSHGMIRHPARFHANGCDPAIGEIVASKPISEKLKLNIVNGLRTIIDKGADAEDRDIIDPGLLLISRDPVAGDSVGFSHLNKSREKNGKKPLLASNRLPKQLLTAADLGLGQYDEVQIALESL